jgi:hypothetical protein
MYSAAAEWLMLSAFKLIYIMQVNCIQAFYSLPDCRYKRFASVIIVVR